MKNLTCSTLILLRVKVHWKTLAEGDVDARPFYLLERLCVAWLLGRSENSAVEAP